MHSESYAMLDGSQITMDCSDGDEWRIPRIWRVIGYVAALAEHYGNDGLLGKVGNLYDHEGTLTVWWKKKPTDGEKELFHKAWGSAIGDGTPETVEHELI